jgi:hypothetical protein
LWEGVLQKEKARFLAGFDLPSTDDGFSNGGGAGK